MNNRALTLAIGLCLLVAGVGKLLTYTPTNTDMGTTLLTWGLGLGQLLSLVLLVSNGTILGTVYAKIILPLYGLLLVGVVFKISHLPWANELLWGALGGIALTYSIRFGHKPQKSRLDLLKLLWVLACCGSALLILLHLAPREAAYVAPMLLWLAVLDFLNSENGRRPTDRF
jgi:hypothetical protein